MKLWTATTDGDNCPTTTTVHASLGAAEDRVRNDLPPDVPRRSLLTGDALWQAWDAANAGACDIQEHVLPMPTVLAALSAAAAYSAPWPQHVWDKVNGAVELLQDESELPRRVS